MKRFAMVINGILLLSTINFAACSNEESHVRVVFSTNVVTRATIDAADRLKEMIKQNRLPGISNGEHGNFASEYFEISESNEVTYPLSRTFHVVKTGEILTNHYTFIKMTAGSNWELVKAWKTDSNGQIVILSEQPTNSM
jgi:hypothetical protein